MPRVRTPDNVARWYLLTGNKSEISRNTGINRKRLYAIIDNPGKITLDELALLAKEQGIKLEELQTIVTIRS